MCRCSAKCDSLSNQLHPLLLFLLATALWHLYTDILDAAIQIQKCAVGQQMQYKVFSCVLHLQQACAHDVTHLARRSLSIPDSSGSRLLTPCVSFSFWTQPHDRLEHTHLSITELVVSWYGILSGWSQCWDRKSKLAILFHLVCFFPFAKIQQIHDTKLFNLKENSLCNCRLSGSSTRDSGFEELHEHTQICSKNLCNYYVF